MKNKILLLATFLLLFQGCIIHSLYPLYTEDIIITDENLEGFWVGANAKENLECPDGLLFEKLEGKNYYQMTTCEDGISSRSIVHLMKIGEYHYLDFYPDRDYPREKGKENKYGFNDFHMVPTHSFARVHVSENKLKIEHFNTDWLEELFKQRKIRIKHEMVEEEILLTASPEDLQKFVKKYSGEEKAFEEGDEMVKRIVKN